MKSVDRFDWQEIARLALVSRAIDELEENKLAPEGHVPYQFSAKGHELGQLLISQLLTFPFDAVGAYYRSRPFMLGSGLTIEEAFASGMARANSVNAGRDVGVVFNMPSRGRATVLPMSGDVGSQYTPAAGWAQAIQYRIEVLGDEQIRGSIVVVFGGDGSVATNGFWSCLTMASTLMLPLLFVIEDNGYALSVESWLQTPGGNIANNLSSFAGLQIWQGYGTRPPETAGLVAEAVSNVRQSQGPGLLRLCVPRLSGHSGHDNQAYKSPERIEEEKQDDPIPSIKEYMVPAVLSEEAWQEMALQAERDVRRASDRALSQQQPDPRSVSQFVFFNGRDLQEKGGVAPEGIRLPKTSEEVDIKNQRRINMVEAIRRTLDVELEINPRCVVFGEDVADKGGVHTATMGLKSKHGEKRVFDTSLSEEGIIGRATGMAYGGLLPVPEIQFRKYADPATEQLNNLGTIRWRTANRFAAPVVVRTAGGFGRKVGDPWHSVTSEVIFAHAVGWLIAFPSNARDAAGLLRTALRGNDPVIFFEHRALLDAASARRPYPGDDYAIPFGKARFVREGDEVTIVSWGAMVERCEAAMDAVGVSADLIDLRTIVPWDEKAVLESVRRCARCLVVHEDIAFAGFGAEIAATVAEKALMDLDAPVVRLGAPQVPVPFNVGLMNEVVPTVEKIQQAITDLIEF